MRTLLIGASHPDSIGTQIGEKLKSDYAIRYFARTSSDIQCDITNPDDVRKMIDSVRDDLCGIINTAGIACGISFNDPLDHERLRDFFATKTLGLYHLAHLGYQRASHPFSLIHIGGTLEDVDGKLSPYPLVNGGAYHFLRFVQRHYGFKINPFYFELGFIRDTHIFREFSQQGIVDQSNAEARLKSCNDIYQEIQKVLREEVAPGSLIRIDSEVDS